MSTLKVNTIQDTSGNTQYMAKAWVNFNGTGTVAIRASGNVSSITDNGTGTYTLNFTNSLVDTNYIIFGSCRYNVTENVRENLFIGNWRQSTSRQTTSCKINVVNTTPSLYDAETVMVGVIR